MVHRNHTISGLLPASDGRSSRGRVSDHGLVGMGGGESADGQAVHRQLADDQAALLVLGGFAEQFCRRSLGNSHPITNHEKNVLGLLGIGLAGKQKRHNKQYD